MACADRLRIDPAIVNVVADHPICGRLQFTPYRQDRRLYYALGIGVLTDAVHAKSTIEYWRINGWIVDADPHSTIRSDNEL